MATVREHFDIDPRALTINADWGMSDLAGAPHPPLTAKVFQDLDANAKYWSFFIPAGVDVRGYLNALLSKPETSSCQLHADGNGVQVLSGMGGYSERASSDTLVYTKRILLYIDAELSELQRMELAMIGLSHGHFVIVRDREYAAMCAQQARPMAFISHDSSDKDALVRDLARELTARLCPVWYDEYSLRVGDSLRASIEKGLKEAPRCILVLSPAFLANKGWGKAEFDSIFTREVLEQKDVVLPVWHNVGVRDVYDYSPRLADKVGLDSSIGVKELAAKLASAMRANPG